jgi:hypothetical protein
MRLTYSWRVVGYTEAIQTGFEEFDRIVTVKPA